jgi:AraC-like DNA-binding protein
LEKQIFSSDWTGLDPNAEQPESDIFSYIYSKLKIGDRRGSTMDGAVEAGRTWRSVMEHIHEHYKEQLSLEKLAAVACVSKYHFVRQFKIRSGYTPYQYILSLWIAEANVGLHPQQYNKHLPRVRLLRGQLVLSVIARTLGMTPEQYRREQGIYGPLEDRL